MDLRERIAVAVLEGVAGVAGAEGLADPRTAGRVNVAADSLAAEAGKWADSRGGLDPRLEAVALGYAKGHLLAAAEEAVFDPADFAWRAFHLADRVRGGDGVPHRPVDPEAAAEAERDARRIQLLRQERKREEVAPWWLRALGRIGLGPFRHDAHSRMLKVMPIRTGGGAALVGAAVAAGVAGAAFAAADYDEPELGVAPKGDGSSAAAFPGEIDWINAPPDIYSVDEY